jgi:hypothetical protein
VGSEMAARGEGKADRLGARAMAAWGEEMTKLPRIVVEHLANEVSANEPHPDANLLTAFVERSLVEKDRVQVLAHLARCSGCRDVVVLSLPEAISTQKVLRPVFASRFSWPVLRWGAAFACVVVVGAAVSLHQRKEVDQTHSGEGKAAAVSAAGRQDTQTALAVIASVPKPVAVAPQGARGEDEQGIGGVPRSMPIPGRAKDDVANSGSENALQTTGDSAINKATSPLSTGSGVPRWALTADGSLQRSFDMGRTWEPVTVSVETSLRAVSASGFDIWVGGTSGALYHSDDAGDHWLKIQPMAAGQPLSSDIIGVEFPDFEDGRLNTASGEIWTTRDGGSTWQVRTNRSVVRAGVQ